MNVAIVGCGLIGRKRALAFEKDDILVACCDTNDETAVKFSTEFGCSVFNDFNKLISEIQCDAVIVAVINKFIKDIVIKSLKSGINVIAEKPLGRNTIEAEQMINQLRIMGKEKAIPVLKTGFNHRFHPAIWQAKKMCDNGEIGRVFNIRARYGHGGRPGMEKEWRASKEFCGGGELLDQGVHIIDLIRWFGGEIKEVFGQIETKFWPLEVEDNAMAVLKTHNDVSSTFHVSWTNWKNIFSFEIFGTDGYLKIEGLGGSYGPETLEFGKRKSEGGRPDIQLFEFPTEDISWKKEWSEFKCAINEKREVIGNGIDGYRANLVIEALYKSSKERRIILI